MTDGTTLAVQDDDDRVVSMGPDGGSPGAIMEVIQRAAADPNTDVDKLERLLGLYERLDSRKAEQEFNVAMVAAQQSMPSVFKNKVNDGTRSKYATLERVNDVIMPIITRHGFSLSFGSSESPLPDHYRVTCTLRHSSGHAVDYFVDVPADTHGAKGSQNKTKTHGFGSTMSYGRRYLTLLIFNVATTDDDDGNAAGGFCTDEQVAYIKHLLDKTDSDTIKFCEKFGWPSLSEIPVKDFTRAVGGLEANARLKGKGSILQ